MLIEKTAAGIRKKELRIGETPDAEKHSIGRTIIIAAQAGGSDIQNYQRGGLL
jgi:hypothetical protein